MSEKPTAITKTLIVMTPDRAYGFKGAKYSLSEYGVLYVTKGNKEVAVAAGFSIAFFYEDVDFIEPLEGEMEETE